jgi:hypothetical protein
LGSDRAVVRRVASSRRRERTFARRGDYQQTVDNWSQIDRSGVALLPSTSALSLPDGVVPLSLGETTFFREVGLVERPAHSRQPAASLLALRILEAAQAQAGRRANYGILGSGAAQALAE